MWYWCRWASQVGSGKDLPANSQDARDVGSIPGSGRSREGNATCCSILAWEIPWTEEPGGLQSMGSQRVGQDGCLVQKIVTIHSLLVFRSEQDSRVRYVHKGILKTDFRDAFIWKRGFIINFIYNKGILDRIEMLMATFWKQGDVGQQVSWIPVRKTLKSLSYWQDVPSLRCRTLLLLDGFICVRVSLPHKQL